METMVNVIRSGIAQQLADLGRMYPAQLVKSLAELSRNTALNAPGDRQELERLMELGGALEVYARRIEMDGLLDDAHANQLVFDYPEAAGLVAKVSGW